MTHKDKSRPLPNTSDTPALPNTSDKPAIYICYGPI